MDMSALTAAFTSLKSAKDIVQALLELKFSSDIQTKVIDLQGRILEAQNCALSAQEEHSALIKRLELLDKELFRLKSWEKERATYVLKEVGPGAFAYIQRESTGAQEPEHWLCCQCYQDGLKSILQFQGYLSSGKVFQCNRCKCFVNLPHPPAEVVVTPKGRSSVSDRY